MDSPPVGSSREDYLRAQNLIRRAIELDPQCAHAHAWHACILGQQLGYGWAANPAAIESEIERELKIAFGLDENDSDVHSGLAEVTSSRAAQGTWRHNPEAASQRSLVSWPQGRAHACEQHSMLSDRLRSTEVERTKRAIEALANVPWAKPVLARLKRAGGIKPENMPLMFEVRFAEELHRAGVTAEYEFPAGVGKSTVEFRLNTKPSWLIELVSVRTSDAARRATRQIEKLYYEQLFYPTPEDPGRSEEGEMITAQQKIGEKVFSRGRPTKFPPRDGSIRLILIDIRGYLDEGGNPEDYWEIAYGWRVLAQFSPDHWEAMVHRWTGRDGRVVPIKGLFEPGNPLRAAQLIRERIHFLGFVKEERFSDKEIQRTSLFLANPELFATREEAESVYSTYPLATVPIRRSQLARRG